MIAECEKQITPLKKLRAKITNKLKNARDYLKTIKEKITKFKKTRAKTGGGIKDQMFSVLKNMYGIKLQAYHGGSLTGKDIQKVMTNAHEIFGLWAGILKRNAKDGCTLKDDEIDQLCARFANLCLLWDGAFSYASKVDPRKEDIAMCGLSRRPCTPTQPKASASPQRST